MQKVKEVGKFDIYELTKDDCRKEGLCYPTFSVYMHGDTEIDETQETTLADAVAWCNQYS